MDAIVTTHQLTKQYGDATAVDAIDLEIAAGKIVCLLGPNGSGKTTTVAMLATLRTPTNGTARVCGFDVVGEAPLVRSSVGVTLQETGLDGLMTGREMLDVQAILHGLGRRAAHRRTEDLIELLDLGDYVDRRLGEWSGGMRRRMDLAAALVHKPRLLFLDEPTTGLDPAGRRALWAEIRRLNSEDDVTVLITTQYLEEAEALADEVIIIKRGSVIAAAPPDRLKELLSDRTYILEFANCGDSVAAQHALGGDIDPNRPRELRLGAEAGAAGSYLRAIAEARLDLASLRVAEPSLEDVFLHLTDAKEYV